MGSMALMYTVCTWLPVYSCQIYTKFYNAFSRKINDGNSMLYISFATLFLPSGMRVWFVFVFISFFIISHFIKIYLVLPFSLSGLAKWWSYWMSRLVQAYISDSCIKFCGNAGWSYAFSRPIVTTINQGSFYDSHFWCRREWFSRKWFLWFTIRTEQPFIWGFREVRS